MHPTSAMIVDDYLVQMHSAFNQYDMKRFKRLQRAIDGYVRRDMVRAQENGEHEVAATMNHYFIQFNYMLRMMSKNRLITKDTNSGLW